MDAAAKFLTAEWRWLAMLNYEADAASLRNRIPSGAELDSWNGRAYVSMVGFLFLRTRVMGFAIPFHQDFEEVNLRFYVRRKVDGAWRRGVVFIKEIVPHAAIAAVAKVLYQENYVALPMRHHCDASRVEYAWQFQGGWNSLAAEISGDAALPVAGSEEEFITEHYFGYTAQRSGECLEYRVEHPPWRVWRADRSQLRCDAAELYGSECSEALSAPPRSAFVAEGSAIAVYRGTCL